MERILLKLENKRDFRTLIEWLSKDYHIIAEQQDQPLEEPFDLAIIDGRSLKSFGARIQKKRRAEEPVLLPFLLVTTRRKGSVPARHLGRLVDDIISRPLDDTEVRARVANLLRLRRLSLEVKREHDQVVKLSVTDDVSGFHNTRYLHRYLDRLLESPKAFEEDVSLVFFDCDNFKKVVDTHGHLLGAKVLREIAQAVHKVLGPEDRLVRYGGDEYVVILPRQSKAEAMLKVEQMRHALTHARFLQKEGHDIHVTASFGLATFPEDARDKRELLACADRCLFLSKTEGKDRIRVAGAESESESADAAAVPTSPPQAQS